MRLRIWQTLLTALMCGILSAAADGVAWIPVEVELGGASLVCGGDSANLIRRPLETAIASAVLPWLFNGVSSWASSWACAEVHKRPGPPCLRGQRPSVKWEARSLGTSGRGRLIRACDAVGARTECTYYVPDAIGGTAFHESTRANGFNRQQGSLHPRGTFRADVPRRAQVSEAGP